MYIESARYFLPDGFDIINHNSSADKIHLYLEEKNTLLKEYQSEIAQSKDFLPEITVDDFPLRDKSVLLYIKRRRRSLVDTGKIIKRDWNSLAKGGSRIIVVDYVNRSVNL